MTFNFSADAPHRREENPFSFKRFLNQDRGARRKEYSPDGSPILVNTSDMSSMLPDFVQDHLIVEQSYMSSPSHHVPIPFDLPISAEDRIDPVQMSLPDFLSDGPIHSQRGEEAAGYLDNHEPGPTNGLSSPGPSRVDLFEFLSYLIIFSFRVKVKDCNEKLTVFGVNFRRRIEGYIFWNPK